MPRVFHVNGQSANIAGSLSIKLYFSGNTPPGMHCTCSAQSTPYHWIIVIAGVAIKNRSGLTCQAGAWMSNASSVKQARELSSLCKPSRLSFEAHFQKWKPKVGVLINHHYWACIVHTTLSIPSFLFWCISYQHAP